MVFYRSDCRFSILRETTSLTTLELGQYQCFGHPGQLGESGFKNVTDIAQIRLAMNQFLSQAFAEIKVLVVELRCRQRVLDRHND